MYDATWYGSTYIVQFLHTSVWTLRLPIGPASLTSDMNIGCRLFWFWIFIVLEQPKFQNSRALSAKRESAKVLITIKKDVIQALPFPVRRAPRKRRSSGPAGFRQIPPPEKYVLQAPPFPEKRLFGSMGARRHLNKMSPKRARRVFRRHFVQD